MNHDFENRFFRSNRRIGLDAFPSPVKLGGEANLFLNFVKTPERGAEHVFAGTLSAGTVCPSAARERLDDGTEFFFEIIPTENFNAEALAPEAWTDELRSAWFARLSRRVSEDFGTEVALPENNREAAQMIFSELCRKRGADRAATDRDRAGTQESLSRKIDEMLAVGGAKRGGASRGKSSDALANALRRIAAAQKIPWDKAAEELCAAPAPDIFSRLKNFVAVRRWRMRRVEFPKNLEEILAEPMLCFRRETAKPVVLFFAESGNVIFDAESGETEPVTAKTAEALDDFAFRFYRLFPEKPITARELLGFIFCEIRAPIFVLAGIALLTGVISLTVPVATEYVTGKIIPTSNVSELRQVLVLLVALAVSNVSFGLIPKITLIAFGTKMLEQTQAAVFDRLLKAPLKIFQDYTSGDLATRAMGGVKIQEQIFAVISTQFVASFTALFSCVMMFYYSAKLAFVGIAFVLVYSAVIVFISRVALRLQIRSAETSGRLSGLLNQFLDGFATVRVGSAEERVIGKYFDDFSVVRENRYRISRLGAVQSILDLAFPSVLALVFYFLVGNVWTAALTVPAFLAFTSAFGNFQNGVIGMANGIRSLLSVVPEMRRVRSVLDTEVECAAGKAFPKRLDGSVEIRHASFRYASGAPLILDDVSLQAKPGEFIAIVGPSGAGKSTLVRLLLGFDVPASGAVYYGGQNLTELDLRAVRRQLGVILQNSTVVPGSILENIVTGTDYTVKDAERALALAAIDKEVSQMPMGIHTVVSPQNISGGQQQRILIARAVVGNPAVIIMDESTSALDNNAQEAVKTNMETLNATRVVIAHRLSTIVNADRIYVLERGKVVQVGTFKELAAREGVFRRLVERQITGTLEKES